MKITQILQKAFNMTFRYRYLWWLSLLAIIGGVATESQRQFSFQFPTEIFSDTPTTSFEDIAKEAFNNIQNYLPIILIVLVILFVISIAFYIIGLIAKSGQIDTILKIDQKKTSDFWQSMSEGKQYAWRIFLIRLIWSIVTLASIIIAIPLLIITLLIFFITIPLLMVYFGILNIIFKNAEIIAIKQNISPIAAIEKSWQLTTSCWKDFLLLWAVNFGISISVGALIFIVSLIVFVSSILLIIAGGSLIYLTNVTVLIPIGILLLLIIILAISILFLFIGSVTHTFYTSYWTLGTSSLLPKK
jgi:hypothetical protein